MLVNCASCRGPLLPSFQEPAPERVPCLPFPYLGPLSKGSGPSPIRLRGEGSLPLLLGTTQQAATRGYLQPQAPPWVALGQVSRVRRENMLPGPQLLARQQRRAPAWWPHLSCGSCHRRSPPVLYADSKACPLLVLAHFSVLTPSPSFWNTVGPQPAGCEGT